jgi:hypothetical protein
MPMLAPIRISCPSIPNGALNVLSTLLATCSMPPSFPPWQADHKLVSAESRHDVAFAQAISQSHRYSLKQTIADMMTE